MQILQQWKSPVIITAGKVLLNSIILGPLSVLLVLIWEAFLDSSGDIFLKDPGLVAFAITIGSFISSVMIGLVSLLLFLPIAYYEISSGAIPRPAYIFEKYLSIIVAITSLLLIVSFALNDWKSLPPEPMSFLVTFYLTGASALLLFSRSLNKAAISIEKNPA